MTRGQRGDADLPPGAARDLVDLLRRLRQLRGASVGQVAIRAGLSRSHVSEVLRGWKIPSPQAAATIARALGAAEDDASKAHRLAGQAKEFRNYQRTHSTPFPGGLSRGRVPSGRGSNGRGSSGRVPGAPHVRPAAMLWPGHPGSDEPAMPQRPVLEVFPVAIGHYADPGLADLDAETRASRLVDLLAPFGGRHRPWAHPARERGADAVQRRLRDWSGPPAEPDNRLPDGPAAGSSVLYWAGHGWSDGTRAALAHAGSPALVGGSGVEPLQLAAAIKARQAARTAGNADEPAAWTLIIIDTSHAPQIADAVMAALHGPDAPERLLLVAVPGDLAPGDLAPGDLAPGGFANVLAGLLASTYRAEHRIALRDLAGQLERLLGPGNVHQRGLGDAALVRTWPPVASWMSAPVDAVRCLEDVLADLTADERSHFVAKAGGAEHGEPSWFFEGRECETAQINGWLHRAAAGMLVVTGRAGSGKSALLGNVLVQSMTGLRDALARRGLVTLPEPAALPPEDVFGAVIHLSGLTLPQATHRVAASAGLGPRPSRTDPALGLADDLDWLAGQIATVAAGRDRPLTILADGLDEAADPLDTAHSLLARIADLPGVRVLVGTRASTKETPDAAAVDDNLLTALGADRSMPSSAPPAAGIVWITRDSGAIRRYVGRRLRHARGYGAGGQTIPGMPRVRDADIDRAAAAVAARDPEFLHASLAVCELIADPSLMLPGRATSLDRLLDGNHQDLFAAALGRLARLDDRYVPLIHALARGCDPQFYRLRNSVIPGA